MEKRKQGIFQHLSFFFLFLLISVELIVQYNTMHSTDIAEGHGDCSGRGEGGGEGRGHVSHITSVKNIYLNLKLVGKDPQKTHFFPSDLS